MPLRVQKPPDTPVYPESSECVDILKAAGLAFVGEVQRERDLLQEGRWHVQSPMRRLVETRQADAFARHELSIQTGHLNRCIVHAYS